MKKLLIVLLSVVGGLTLIVVGLFLFFSLAQMVSKPGVSSFTVLEVDFEVPMIETIPDDPFAAYLLSGTPTVLDRVLALRRAARDDRVVGLVARVGSGGLGMANTQEMRDAITAFRASGKFAVVYSETLGEMGPGNGGLYLASAFEEIWLQPSGDVGLTGLILEHPFVQGTLEKLGVKAHIEPRYEYKNAVNLYTESEFTEPHREAMQALMDVWFDQIVSGVAEGRGMSEQEVRDLADRGPFYGQEAMDAGLVDGLAYRDEVYDMVRERVDGTARFLGLQRYLSRSTEIGTAGTIALIYGVGGVRRGSSSYDPMSGEVAMGSKTVAKAIRDAVDDSAVDAILFRIDCPGGSFVASDTIWRAVKNAQAAGKPVVISMGSVAASGGYFVAMPATRIVAQPGTITGSIGVFAGKMITSGMWEKIGLTWDEVHTSRNADQFSSLRDYSPEGLERLRAGLDRVYDVFTTKVAEGRGLELERVLEIARGRVWTGQDALELGLVDALGGFHEALRLAKEEAGIDPDRRVALRLYPRPRSTLELFLEGWSEVGTPRRASQTLLDLQAAVKQARRITMGPAPYGVLSMPPIEPVP